MELARHDGYDTSGGYFIGLHAYADSAVSFLDVDDLHLFMPVHGDGREIQRDRAEICIVGESRLLMELRFVILYVFFYFHDSIIQFYADIMQEITVSCNYNAVVK